jgi:hypothetical protein
MNVLQAKVVQELCDALDRKLVMVVMGRVD